MTQQNETDPAQPTAAEPQASPTPVFPSPYLDGGAAVPEAYLAPPQPGEPPYGTPPYPRGGRVVGGRPGNGRAGYAQPNGPQGNGQARYRQSASGRPAIGFGAAAHRDPALASPWLRLVASTLDWFIILVVSVIAFWSPLSQVWRAVRAVTGHYPDLTSPAAQAALNSISRSPTNQHALVYWFLGIFGIALAYYWVQHAAWGATIGKRALGLRVVRASDQSRVSVLTTGIRTVAYLVGPAIFLLLLYPVNVAGGLLWAADAGMPLVSSRAQSLHDRLAGTIVVRKSALGQPSRPPGSW
jgi:uncharacterized RDD family membrane protein YckC